MRYLMFIVISSFVDIFIKDKIESDYEKVEKVYNKSKLKKYISLNKLHNYGFPFGKLKKFCKICSRFYNFSTFYKAYEFYKSKKEFISNIGTYFNYCGCYQ